jgi:glycerophosphoryl diester phosphodiesterase
VSVSIDHRPVLRVWRTLAATDVLYKSIAFAVLTPLIGLLLRLLIRRTGTTAVADVDIALFFFTTRSGAMALVLVLALIVGVTAIEQACLMTIVLGALRGEHFRVRDGFAHGFRHAFAILRLTVFFVLRLIAIAAPFAAVSGLAYWALLTGHDINFYLTDRPPAFWVVGAIAAVVVATLATVLARKVSDWLLALPLVTFEGVLPVFAFAESARRMVGRRKAAAGALAAWAAFAIALPFLTTWGAQWVGRTIAPAFSSSLTGLLLFVGCLVLVWGAASLAVGIVTATLFAWIVMMVYVADGGAADARLPARFRDELTIEGRRWRVSWGALVGMLAGAVILATGAAYVLMSNTWTDRPVSIFAHRGASAEAPENTLAAFELAGVMNTDYVELDVQESSDGVVVVVHDSDLMKVGGSPLKIWEATAEQLRAVDIGSRVGPQFKSERVPTLAEALQACKGVSRVDIELKFYGHDERLEERVVELVEAAGMESKIVTMSLHHDMVTKMKRLRPTWPSGLLTAKALGDLSRVPADFLAVEKAMATRRFIWTAHRAGKPVYVWTVDDPARMIRMIGLGVDGLITNRPDVARDVVDGYARMAQAQRLFVFVMTTLGAPEDLTPADADLRP